MNISPLPQSYEDYCRFIAQMHLPRYDELPAIDLYMDQLLTYLEKHLRQLYPADDKLITASMVNNYVKQGIVPTPQSKRYTADHVAYLIAVCLLKRAFSMQDMLTMLDIQVKTHELSNSYNFLCTAMELTLQILFNNKVSQEVVDQWAIPDFNAYGFSITEQNVDYLTPERKLALSSISCAASKIYVEKSIEYHSWEPTL